ncbi:MAG: hypothetical protein ABSE49_29330 [Polyangiaceae bacterium]
MIGERGSYLLGFGGSGCWMLAVAAGEGLLRTVGAIVLRTGGAQVEA